MDNPDGTVTRGPGPETASGGAALPQDRAPRLLLLSQRVWTCGERRLVRAGFNGATVEHLVVRALPCRGDRLGAAARHRADEVGRPCAARPDQRRVPAAEHAEARVLLQLGTGVGDVEVAHGQLANPVRWPERRVLHPLHRQLVWVVAERRP